MTLTDLITGTIAENKKKRSQNHNKSIEKISNRQKRFLKAIFPKNWMKENRKIMHKNVNYKSNIHKNGNA